MIVEHTRYGNNMITSGNEQFYYGNCEKYFLDYLKKESARNRKFKLVFLIFIACLLFLMFGFSKPMFAKADVVTVRKDSVLSIPKDIIKNRPGGKLVYTVNRNSAEEKVIQTGISDDEYIEVEKGLEAGDKIVVKGYEWLRNRSKVKVMK